MGKTRKDNHEKSDTQSDNQLKYVCKRHSCGMRFQHKTQLYRHKRTCLAKSPMKPKKNYIKVHGRFQCIKCEKQFDEQTNAIRHTKSCKDKENHHQCKFCDKIFTYKSRLLRHEKSHREDIATPSMIPCHNLSEDVTSFTDDSAHCTDPDYSDYYDSEDLTPFEVPGDTEICTSFEVPIQDDIEIPLHESTIVSDVHFSTTEIQSSTIIFPESNNDRNYEQSNDVIDVIEPESNDDGNEQSNNILIDDDGCDKIMLDGLCKYLRDWHKTDSAKFKNVIIDIFGTERLSNYSFQYYLSTKIDINYQNFKRSMKQWLKCGMMETRGRPKLSLEHRQSIYDTWLDNAQPSTDNRNNRCQVRISLNEFEERYAGLENKNVELIHQVNQRGRKNVAANRMIATTTVRGIQKKLAAKGVTVSTGSIINNKPFFITYATEKELSLCLCKLCINMTFLFEPMMAKAKKDGDETFESISTFFMHDSTCLKAPNGYYTWKCVNRKCSDCRSCLSATLKCMDSDELVSVDQFETVNREYYILNKKNNKIEKKTTKLTDRVSKKITYHELYKKSLAMRKTYMIHKYYVYNDKHHWPKILATVPEYGEITHSDYSENMSQLHKREAQACHFNKKPYSLHCTVEHVDPAKYVNLKSPYRYIYHLSDSMKHDYAFTSIVANHCVDMNPLPTIIRRKSDNCGVQYKSAYVFGEYQKMAKRTDRKVLVYYGPSGHGKGLVDAMSAFGVKGPLLRKVLTEDFSYKCANDICEALKVDFEGDDQKLYFVVSEEETLSKEDTKLKLKIAGVVKNSYHMICFFPSGKILAKVNICSCNVCLLGKFELCKIEKGVIISTVDDDCDDDTDSDIEYEDDENVEDGSEDLELYELRREAVLEITKPGYVVALFVPKKTVLQSFYLCRVISIQKATADDMSTIFKKHPFIEEGTTYLKCQYFEKKPGSELSKSGAVIYKPRVKLEYALPTHVVFPQVNHTCIGKNIILTIQEYNWICDSIPQFNDADD